jgi:hypothetical protein
VIADLIEGTNKGTLIVTLRPSKYTVVLGTTVIISEALLH